MIFVTLGSQKFQFNRLLREIDDLIKDRTIKEQVFAQIGYSDYKPQNYEFKKFLDRDEYVNRMENSETVITHGGTGAIIGAVKKGKKVIAVARLSEFGEHVDNHQLQILKQFDGMGIIRACDELKDLKYHFLSLKKIKLKPYVSNTETIIHSIDEFLKYGSVNKSSKK
jgi:UDP-N-acetylglucosamine transferase subunit ALG13